MSDTVVRNNDSPEAPAAADAVIVKKSAFSLIWLLPIVVALVGGWMVYKSYENRGVPITIHFEMGDGIDAGKTVIKHRGVIIGQVEKVGLNEEKNRVVVTAELKKEEADFAREGSQFWLVKPRISLQKISGLDTLISGPYIGASKGGGAEAGVFQALDEPPFGDQGRPGFQIVLKTRELGSLKAGDHVYYRQFKVGEITDCQLASTSQYVLMDVTIDTQYAHIIRENSVFWNTSGIGIKLSILHSKLQTAPLETLLEGGVAFATPNNEDMGPPVEEGEIFVMHPESKKEWLEWNPVIEKK